MILVDTQKRITAQDMLSHPWLEKHKEQCCEFVGPHEHDKISSEILAKLRTYKGESLLKRMSINILVK